MAELPHMRYLLGLLILGLIGLSGCGDERDTTTADSTAATTPPPPPPPLPPIPPEELATALTTLSDQIQRQVGQAADALLQAEPTNATRRQTLRWRLRIADICRNARARDNAMAGLIELWYWTLATNRFVTIGS